VSAWRVIKSALILQVRGEPVLTD